MAGGRPGAPRGYAMHLEWAAGMERLQKVLARCGVGSRRECETLIEQGRVEVDGKVVTKLGTKVEPGGCHIKVDGERVGLEERVCYLVNKPRGYVCTRSDPQQRPTIIQLLGEKGIHGYLYPVGRLDFDSEGLILITNDGDLAARLTHPRHGVEREYEARVRGVPGERALDRLRRGVLIEGRRTAPAMARLVTALKGGEQAILIVTLREGRNRQVRQMCDLIGHPVQRLRRLRIGPISDRDLKPGQVRVLTTREVLALKQAGERMAPGKPEEAEGETLVRERRRRS